MTKALVLCVLAALACASAASAQTVTSIGDSTVRAANDFATRAFQDPWDMNERTDLGWFLHGSDQPSPNLTNITFAGGVFSATATSNDPNFYLLDTGSPTASRVGKFGLNYPIDATTHRVFAFRMSSSVGSTAQFFWNRETIYDNTTTLGGNVSISSGYRIYLVDLAALSTTPIGPAAFSWGGTVKALRLDPVVASGATIALDWARLVSIDQTLCRTISWTGGPATVDIYLDDDNVAGNGHLGPIALGASNSGATSASVGCPTSGTGYKFYAGALAPGMYRVIVVGSGVNPVTSATSANYSSGRWVVNDTPTLAFTSPSPEGSTDDFATTVLNDPWDMNKVADFDFYTNVTNPLITTMTLETAAGVPLGSQQVFRGTSTPAAGGLVGDPYLAPLWVTQRGFTQHIDTTRYRILTFEFGIPDKPRSLLNGSIARIVWRVAGEADASVTDDIIFNHRAGANVLEKIVVDMADRVALPIEQGNPLGWVNGSTNNPGLDIFRVDPHEFDAPTDFFIRRIKLAALERADASYAIQWAYSDASAAGTVTLSYDTDKDPSSGLTAIASSVPTTSAGGVSWNTSGVPNGTYYVHASFSDGTNTNSTYAAWPIVINHGGQDLPRLVVNRPTLNFGVTNLTTKTSSQLVRVTVVGTGAPCWTVDNSRPSTFVVTGGAGCGSGAFTVSLVDRTYNVVGEIEGSLSVRGTTAGTIDNSPSVRVWARTHGATSGPFGFVDTPADNAVVSGSIGVTGWALDDIEVTSVTVWRDPVAGESGSRTFVGTAVRLDDSRSDLEIAAPTTPFNYRAGWGFLVLTNFLPGGGDGTYVLRIYASDREGRETLIGSRTIIGVNSSSSQPFGAIDTPAQGETIGGTNYNNFGWVLVRGPAFATPAQGGTVTVVIDGVAVGSPCCWASRSDLVTLFAAGTYPGVNQALGVFSFNPSLYADGVHTIAWGVTATNGQSDGVGSRFFNIFNASSVARASSQPNVITARAIVNPGRSLGLMTSALPIAAAPRFIRATAGSRVTIDAAELRGNAPYEAYLSVGGVLRGLPVGSSFDERRGAFYWQPAPGFAGQYDLVFVRDGKRLPVQVTLAPSGPRRTTNVHTSFRTLFTTSD